MDSHIVTTTDRLFFRPIALGDEKYIFPEVDDELTKYWIDWEPSTTLIEERKRIEDKLKLLEMPPNFEWLAFDVSGKFIGCCGISPSEESGEFEVNLWVIRSEQGKGYAKEMLQEALAWTKENTSLTYLIYSYTEGNEASAAIIHRMGVPLYRTVSHLKRGVHKNVYDHKIMI